MSAAASTTYLTPLGYSSHRPAVDIPPIDRSALMQAAHAIARKSRQHFASYREALAYGLTAAWKQVKSARSIRMLSAQVERRDHSVQEIAASRAATRRCGSSFVGA
jgi:hypothetical protein